MDRKVAVLLYAVAMVAVIVGVDFAFFRNRFWERLTVNVGIVLVFGAFYFRFLSRPCTRRNSVNGKCRIQTLKERTCLMSETSTRIKCSACAYHTQCRCGPFEGETVSDILGPGMAFLHPHRYRAEHPATVLLTPALNLCELRLAAWRLARKL